MARVLVFAAALSEIIARTEPRSGIRWARPQDGPALAAAGLDAIAGGQGLSQADYDNDGCLDLLVTRGAWQGPMPISLLRGDCRGRFRDVTSEAGLDRGRYASQLGVWIW